MSTPLPEVFPFAHLNHCGCFPSWVRGLRHENGVYVFRERGTDEIVYVGESHSARLYSTLTRHFQAWSNKYDTAGVTYARDEVDIGAIVVPEHHAVHLQNELICILMPRDNRLTCEQIFSWEEEADDDEREDRAPPADYDYDVHLLLEGLAYEFPDGGDDIPF